MVHFAPSILAADFSNLMDEIKKVKEAKYLHLDIMDGNFVPNITFGPDIIKSLRPHTDHIFDTHLMIDEPEKYIDTFAKAGSDIITFHAETTVHHDRIVNQVKETGCQSGIALNPATPLSLLEYLLPELDQVLLLTVNPGFGGQKFIPQMVKKIKKVKTLITKNNLDIRLQIDGGVNYNNVKKLADLGVDLFVTGSAIFKTKDPSNSLSRFKKIVET